MIHYVGIKKAKAELGRLMALTQAGETVVLTRRGRPVVWFKPVGQPVAESESGPTPRNAEA